MRVEVLVFVAEGAEGGFRGMEGGRLGVGLGVAFGGEGGGGRWVRDVAVLVGVLAGGVLV